MADFKNKKIQHIAVLCSGGDAPGMNAAVRSVVRSGIFHKLRVTAVLHGYEGLLSKSYENLELSSVANIIQRGGTVIKTGRCLEFYEPKGRAQAAKNFMASGFDGLVAIG